MRADFSTSHYVDDIKALLLPHPNFYYHKTRNETNLQHNNTIFCRKNPKHPKKNRRHPNTPPRENFKFNEHIIDLSLIESMIFGIDVLGKLEFEETPSKCYKNRKEIHNRPQKLDIRTKENSFFIYLRQKTPGRRLPGITKINDEVYVTKLQSQSIPNGYRQKLPDIKNFKVESALKNGFEVIYIEKDYFSFNPVADIEILRKRDERYFNTFQCSYRYYVERKAMGVILDYYDMIERLLGRLEKEKENNLNLMKINLELERINSLTYETLKKGLLL